MTFKYNTVYINNTETIAGKNEKEGPLGKIFDKTKEDFYFGEKTWEQAEIKLLTENIKELLKKTDLTSKDIDILISGDLLNQIAASNYAASKVNIPYLGIYSACATSVEGLIISANMIEAKQANKIISLVSSHNNTAEKQFRYPVEYGGPKPKTMTFTATGSAGALVTNIKKGIKIESATIGRAKDSYIKEVFYMGAVMAIAAAETIKEHLDETNRNIDYYDLVLTGDLGKYGKEILKDYLKNEYKINSKNIDDSACMIYDLEKQSVYSGASGPVCLPLVTYSYIFNKMHKGEYKKVLLVATGALMNTSTVNQKMNIPSIAHAISLEVVD